MCFPQSVDDAGIASAFTSCVVSETEIEDQAVHSAERPAEIALQVAKIYVCGPMSWAQDIGDIELRAKEFHRKSVSSSFHAKKKIASVLGMNT